MPEPEISTATPEEGTHSEADSETELYIPNLEHLSQELEFSFADLMSASSLVSPDRFQFSIDDSPVSAIEPWDPTEEDLPAGLDLVSAPTPSLELSKTGLNMIVMFEVSSDAYFNSKLIHPIWPGASSGITIGIGYDLGYNSAATIRSDWSMLDAATLNGLVKGAGVTGTAAKNLLPQLKPLIVRLEPSKKVFYSRTLVKFTKTTRATYPGVEDLPADAQTALLSLIYNRGPLLSGSSRTEMAAIKPLVKNGDLAGIAKQIRSMKRLWDKSKLPGLHIRRDKEADMVEHARKVYPAGEVVFI